MSYDRPRLVERLTREFERNPAATLDAMASAVGVHRHTAAAAIRGETGASFEAWRDHERARLVVRLLLEHGDLSIKEVAALTGFATSGALHQFAVRVFGRTPSDLRRHHGRHGQ